MTFQKRSAVVAAAWLACCVLTAAGQAPTAIKNAAGVRLMVADDADPTLRIVAPGHGDDGAFQVIFPEHVTVRARGNDEATHVYLWQPGQAGKAPAAA